MKTYNLLAESGPQHKKTMVHVLALHGLTANGPTTDAALAATPGAIRAYLRFMRRHSIDSGDPAELFETRVVQHFTKGDMLGTGSAYLIFEDDLRPMTAADIDDYLARFGALREALAAWAEAQTDAALDAKPEKGRTARAILQHTLEPTGAYTAVVSGGSTGFSNLSTRAKRGQIPMAEALREACRMLEAQVLATTPEQRAAVLDGPSQVRTLRKGLRRTIGHDWEHLEELSRRPGGPEL